MTYAELAVVNGLAGSISRKRKVSSSVSFLEHIPGQGNMFSTEVG